jgi:hypothetical protein
MLKPRDSPDISITLKPFAVNPAALSLPMMATSVRCPSAVGTLIEISPEAGKKTEPAESPAFQRTAPGASSSSRKCLARPLDPPRGQLS